MTDPMQRCFSEATLNGLPLRNRLIKAGLLERNPALRCGDMVARIGRRYSGQSVREVDAWTREEAAILLTKAREHEPFVYPVLLAAFCTGMRRGELLALRWEHIQPDGIRVRDSLVRGVTKGPKSDRARSVPISPEMKGLIDNLRRSRREREGAWSEPELIFTTRTGGAVGRAELWPRLATAPAAVRRRQGQGAGPASGVSLHAAHVRELGFGSGQVDRLATAFAWPCEPGHDAPPVFALGPA